MASSHLSLSKVGRYSHLSSVSPVSSPIHLIAADQLCCPACLRTEYLVFNDPLQCRVALRILQAQLPGRKRVVLMHPALPIPSAECSLHQKVYPLRTEYSLLPTPYP
jgi:hypothetical protein